MRSLDGGGRRLVEEHIPSVKRSLDLYTDGE
jgi:hypothetical protein